MKALNPDKFDFLLSVLVILALLVSGGFTTAGEIEDSGGKALEIDPNQFEYENSDWEAQLRPYLWTASLKGDLGVNGLVVPVDVGFDDILDNLDFAFATTLDIQKSDSRFGAIFDFSYLKISPSIDPVPAPLFSTVGIDVEMTLFDAVATYRLSEWDRGYVDLMAGMRYTGLDMGLRITSDPAGITAVSDSLASEATSRASIHARESVSEKVDAIQSNIQGTIDGITPPGILPGPPNGPIRKKVRNLVEAKQAEIQTKAQGAAASVIQKAERASAKAEKELSRQLSKSINNGIPAEVGGSENWWDPHVGIRAKHFVSEQFYLTGIADVGGFGVGSDLAIQAGGGIGYQVNERFSMEFLYRYLKTDYENGGFVYDTEMSGLFLGGAFYFGH